MRSIGATNSVGARRGRGLKIGVVEFLPDAGFAPTRFGQLGGEVAEGFVLLAEGRAFLAQASGGAGGEQTSADGDETLGQTGMGMRWGRGSAPGNPPASVFMRRADPYAFLAPDKRR